MTGLRTFYLLTILLRATIGTKSESVRIGVLTAPGGSCQWGSDSKCAQNRRAAETAVGAANDWSQRQGIGVAIQQVTAQIAGGATRLQMAQKAKNMTVDGVCALFLIGDDDDGKRLDDVFAYVTNDPIPRFYIDHRVSRSDYNYFLLPGNDRTHVMVGAITRAYRWPSIAVINDGVYDMEGVEHVLAENTDDRVPMGAFIVRGGTDRDVTSTLLEVRASGLRRIMIHCEIDIAKKLIRKAAELNMVNQYYHWMISHPQPLDKLNEALLSDLSPEARVTAFQRPPPPPEDNMNSYQVLVYDAITAFARGVWEMKTAEGDVTNCRQNIMTYMPQGVPFEGKSGMVAFDPDGSRSNITRDVLEFQRDGFKPVGTLSLGGSANLQGSKYLSTSPVWNLAKGKHFRVVTFQDSVFLRDRDDGYLVDLLKEMSSKNRGDFTYDLQILPKPTKLRDVIRMYLAVNATKRQRDFALVLAPLREKLLAQVDITRPIATLGYTVTMRKQDPPTITLLSPLRNYTWAYVLLVYACVSMLSSFIDKLDPYEWGMRNKDKVNKMEDAFSLTGGFWQGLTSFCRQGVVKSPRSIGGRILTGSWWFFALVIFAYYVSTFSAILSKDDTIKVKSVSDLAYQNKIAYGLNKNILPLLNFFKNTQTEPYATMWRYMKKNQRNLVASNEAGMRKVLGDHQCGDGGKFAGTNESYAFVTTSRVEFDYQDKYNCSLRTVGNYFLPYELGLPFPKGSVFKDIFDKIIIDMQNDGSLQKLQMKWLMNPTQKCPREDTMSMQVLAPDGLAPMFGVVAAAIVLGVLVALVELLVYWNQKKRNEKVKDSNGAGNKKRGCLGRLLNACCGRKFGEGDEKDEAGNYDETEDFDKMPEPLPPLSITLPSMQKGVKDKDDSPNRTDELLARLAAMSNAAAAQDPTGDYRAAKNGFPKPPTNPALNQGVKRDVLGVSKQGTFRVSTPDKDKAPSPPSDFRA